MTTNNNKPESTFKAAVANLGTYPSFNKVPGAQFRRIFSLMKDEGISFEVACEEVAAVLEVSRDKVRDRLEKCRPSKKEILPRRYLDLLDSVRR